MRITLQKWLIALLIAWAFATQASAYDEPVYRVDVIVFAHNGGQSNLHFSAQASDFSDYPDLIANKRAVNLSTSSSTHQTPTARQAGQRALATIDRIRALENRNDQSQRPTDGPTLLNGLSFPPTFIALDELSSQMLDSWERLKGSARHTPLLWRSWYQPLSAGNRGRWLRISGGQLLGIDWLQAEVIMASLLPEHPPYPFRLPRTRHQLDGIVRLRQRQFMHIDLELVRQVRTNASLSPLRLNAQQPEGFSRHVIEQSRAIRPDRIEYFDSSLLGVLILVQQADEVERSGGSDAADP